MAFGPFFFGEVGWKILEIRPIFATKVLETAILWQKLLSSAANSYITLTSSKLA